jgi:hypothetical protein
MIGYSWTFLCAKQRLPFQGLPQKLKHMIYHSRSPARLSLLRALVCCRHQSGRHLGLRADAGAHHGPEAFVGLSLEAKIQPDGMELADFHRGMANKACLAPNIWEGLGEKRQGARVEER